MAASGKIYDRMAANLPINAVVSPAVVDDPYGGSIMVLRSTRDDPFASMYTRGHISPVQFNAGRAWQQYHEWAEIGGAHAIDPTVEPVDGGRYKTPDITRQSRAMGELSRAAAVLQPYRASLVRDILVRHMTITEIAAARSVTSGRQIVSLMASFREALDDLAVVFGLSTA